MDESRSRGIVYLLRHGEPVGGKRYRGATDDPLSADGWRQMRGAVAGCGAIDRIVASPLRRCAEFARALAEGRGLPLAVDAGFREMHFGAWEGKTPRALMAACPRALRRFWSDPGGHPPPGGEPLDQFCARVVAAWAALARAMNDERVLLITHGGVVRAILGQIRELPPNALVNLNVPYAGMHRIAVDAGGGMREIPQTGNAG